MKLLLNLVVAIMLFATLSSPSVAQPYNGVTFGDYPTWADEAFEPQGN